MARIRYPDEPAPKTLWQKVSIDDAIRVEEVITDTVTALSNSLATHFPEIKTGDERPELSDALSSILRRCTLAWIADNGEKSKCQKERAQ